MQWLLNIYFFITSALVSAQVSAINSTNMSSTIIMASKTTGINTTTTATITVMITTSTTEMSSVAVLNQLSSSFYIFEITDTPSTTIQMVTISITSSSEKSSTAVINKLQPTSTSSKGKSISSFIIGIIVGVSLGIIVFIISIVIYIIVTIVKKKKESGRNYRTNIINQRQDMTAIANEVALVFYDKHHKSKVNKQHTVAPYEVVEIKMRPTQYSSEPQPHSSVSETQAEPYLEPNCLAMEYETPVSVSINTEMDRESHDTN